MDWFEFDKELNFNFPNLPAISSSSRGRHVMAVSVQQVIEDVKYLSAQDRALVAHCLITSLDALQEDAVEQTWADLADRK